MAPKIDFNPDGWVDNYSDELYCYALSRIKDTGFAEDIVQETFLSAWRAQNTYKGEASEKNWLYAICKNKIIDHFRKHAAKEFNTELPEEELYFDLVEHWKEEPTPKEWQVNYSHSIESREFYTVLDNCKNKLKDIQESIFVLKYMEDMKAEIICKVLDISMSNYWVLLHRCRLHLRSCLEKNWINV